MSYAIEFNGKVFTPDGHIRAGSIGAATPDIEARNRETEAREIEALKAHPERAFLYASHDPSPKDRPTSNNTLQTWMGTTVSSWCYCGPRVYDNFGGYRRSVRAVIFGRNYYGWYYESSGQYCRLKRCKV